MRNALLALLITCSAALPALAEIRVENGVRVHRMNAAPSTEETRAAPVRAPDTVSIGLDRSYGVAPSCTSMDWRRSVSRETWEARCGRDDYYRWYDRWIYRDY